MSSWKGYRQGFRSYLQLERSLSVNTLQAYEDDIIKLEQFSLMRLNGLAPPELSKRHLSEFVDWVAELSGPL